MVYVVVSNYFLLSPITWGNVPIWLAHIFQMGWLKPPTSGDCDLWRPVTGLIAWSCSWLIGMKWLSWTPCALVTWHLHSVHKVVEGGIESQRIQVIVSGMWVNLVAEQKFVEHEARSTWFYVTRGAELASCTPYTKLHSGLVTLILQKLIVFLSMAELKLEVPFFFPSFKGDERGLFWLVEVKNWHWIDQDESQDSAAKVQPVCWHKPLEKPEAFSIAWCTEKKKPWFVCIASFILCVLWGPQTIWY